MGKHRKRGGPTKVQGLSVDAVLRQRQPVATFVDDFTGDVLPLKVEPVAEGLQPSVLQSGDALHQLAQMQQLMRAAHVLQQAGLSPKPPKPLTLSEAVQRAAVYAQLRGPVRGTRR